jgi:tetratricopeptide (TPR) repeat protein
LLEVEILSDRREVVENTFAYIVAIKAAIDTKILNERIEEIRDDKDLREELESERERIKELEAQIEEMNQPTAKVDRPALERLVNRLRSTDLITIGNASKDPKKILELTTKAIKYDKKSVRAYALRAFTYYKLKKYHAALKDYNSAIKLSPNEAKLYHGRSAVYRALGNRRLARKDMTKANQLNPKTRRSRR